jgi:hypothetical protein
MMLRGLATLLTVLGLIAPSWWPPLLVEGGPRSHSGVPAVYLRFARTLHPRDPSRLQRVFALLTSIVFGVNTAEANKVKIIKVIAVKCKTENQSRILPNALLARRERVFQVLQLSPYP